MGGFIAEGYGQVVPDDEDGEGEDNQEVWEGGGNQSWDVRDYGDEVGYRGSEEEV